MKKKVFATDTIPIGLLQVDAFWKIKFINQQAKEFGFEDEFDLITQLEENFLISKPVKDSLSSKNPFFITSKKYIENRYLLNIGELDETISTSRIVTVSKVPVQENETNNQYNAFVKNAVDRLPTDLVIYDNNLNFVYINEVAVKDPELREWLIGKSIGDYVRYRGLPEEHEISRMSFFKSIVDNKKPVTWVDEYYYKDGTEKYMLRNYFPYLNQQGQVEFLFGSGVDITNEKLGEKKSKELIKDLTVRNQLLKQFSFVVSHKLRQHSGNLLGLSFLTKEVEEGEVDLEELMTMVKKVTLDLDANLHDLNRIVHINDESVILKKVRVKDIILDVLDNVQQKLSYNKKINIDYKSDVNEINIDEIRFRSILNEILSNCMKYAKSKKELDILISISSSTKTLKMSFRDNGIGIDLRKYKDKLYELYKRFRPDYAHGRGIGLFVLKTHVLSMKGQIDIKSTLGRGTTVILTFPKENLVRQKDLTISKRI